MTNEFTTGYALLIGVDQNNVPAWALPNVAKDVQALAAVLTDPGRCGYPLEQVRILSGAAATRGGILDGLDWLGDRLKKAGGNTTAVVYYSGHGWRDLATRPAQFYLIPCDVREDQVRSRALRAADFADAVDGLGPQRLLVVLDCCHAAGIGAKDVVPGDHGVAGLEDMDLVARGFAGSALPSSLLMAGEPPWLDVVAAKSLDLLGRGRGRAVLSSSTGEQRSFIRRDGRMSIFTFHLIEALTGHAAPPPDAREVLVSDVMSHVSRRVPLSARSEWGQPQEPDYRVQGNFPIALLLGGKGLEPGSVAPDPLSTAAAPPPGTVINVDTGGGAYIGGSLSVGGDFTGRDRIGYGGQDRDKGG